MRWGRRKALTVAGYSLAAVTKPLFPLAGTIGLVLLARFLDRIGKGIRGAPRDALVADLTPADQRGAAFGLRESLDTVGATLGPAAAIGLMYLSATTSHRVVVAVIRRCWRSRCWCSASRSERKGTTAQVPLQASEIGALARPMVGLVAGAIFNLARSARPSGDSAPWMVVWCWPGRRP